MRMLTIEVFCLMFHWHKRHSQNIYPIQILKISFAKYFPRRFLLIRMVSLRAFGVLWLFASITTTQAFPKPTGDNEQLSSPGPLTLRRTASEPVDTNAGPIQRRWWWTKKPAQDKDKLNIP